MKLVLITLVQSGGSVRVLRGGSWSSGDARYLRTSVRFRDWPEYRFVYLGLRLVRRLP